MRKFFIVLAVVAVGAIGGGLWWMTHGRATAATAQTEKPESAVPVLVETAKAEDFPIILRGLGSVKAYNTVPLKSRVEGAITKINFKQGQEVHAGDVLLQIDPRPYQDTLDEAKAKLTHDEATLSNDQVNLQRYSKLLSQSFTPEQQYANQKATVAQDQANIQSDKDAIKGAQLNVDYSTITSPVNGVTGIRQVDLGALVTANSQQTLVTVTQVKPIYVVFTLPEADIQRIRGAMVQGPLTVDAFAANDEKQISQGVLNLINNTVSATTGTVELEAQFANTDEALWPGEFVNAHLVLSVVHNGVTVPTAAVQTGPNGSFTYVVTPDSTVDMRPIKISQTENNTVLVLSGLAAGDHVVTAGQYRLDQGTKVKASAQNAGVAPPENANLPLGVETEQ